MRASTARPAASHSSASATAASGVMSQGKSRPGSGGSRASSAGSARPAQSSSAVWRANAQALATVSRTASGDRSAVLAEPLRWPK